MAQPQQMILSDRTPVNIDFKPVSGYAWEQDGEWRVVFQHEDSGIFLPCLTFATEQDANAYISDGLANGVHIQG